MNKKLIYKTIETKVFFIGELGEYPFNEREEYDNAKIKLYNDICNYCINKLGEDYISFNSPKRMTVVTNGIREYYHISEALYSKDNTKRVLFSKLQYSTDTTAIFQILSNKK